MAKPTISPIKILTDDVETKPTSEFQKISQKVTGIIFGTFPKITIGIYGEWGTGKSTLMKLIQENLTKNDASLTIPSIWFNAWRYEREEISSTIPLILAIINELQSQIESQHTILPDDAKRFWEKAKKYVSMFSGSINVGVEGIASGTLNIDPSKIEDTPIESYVKNNLPTIQEGIEIIDELKSQLTSDLPNNLKLVVFIDDIDRCSPDKSLEIFESMKVLLDFEGIVYVLGISHETIDKLITTAYKDADIKGKDYIRKIIQIPIQTPIWNKKDIKEIIQKNLASKLDKKHSTLIKENKILISTAVENNPRELKRFINRIILAKELAAKNESIVVKELLVSEALSNRWPEQFLSFLSDSKLIDLALKYCVVEDFISRKTKIENDPKKADYPERYAKLLEFTHDLWNFIVDTKDILKKIDLAKYSKLTESFKTPTDVISNYSGYTVVIECNSNDAPLLIQYLQSIQNVTFYQRKIPNGNKIQFLIDFKHVSKIKYHYFLVKLNEFMNKRSNYSIKYLGLPR